MPIVTEDRQLPVPIGSDPDNVPSDMFVLADRLKRDISISYGVSGSRPTTPSARWEGYLATDTGQLWLALTSSAWTLIGPDALSPGSVGTTQLANNGVTGAKIVDGAVTGPKITGKAVTWDKIADNTIGSAQLAADAVDAVRLAPGAVEPDALATSTLALLAPAPIGSVMAYAGTADPAGGRWMICNNRALVRATFQSLFDVIGIAFGAGNGTTTFSIPSLTDGREIVGGGGSVGATGGSNTVQVDTSAFSSHSHAAQASNYQPLRVDNSPSAPYYVIPSGTQPAGSVGVNGGDQNTGTTGGGSSPQTIDTRSPYVRMNYIIRVA